MITKTMIFSDLHLPYEDKAAVDLVLTAVESLNVDRIILNGDVCDFYNVNLHGPKHPDIIETLEYELDYSREWLERLRARFPNIDIIYLSGNHEKRLERFIIQNSKVFWNMITPKKYFRLDELNIKWLEYQDVYRIDQCNLYIVHSPASYGKNHAMTNLEKKLDTNFLYSCTHRMGTAYRTGGSGEVYAAYMLGWLGDRAKKVFSYTKGHDSWQHSCAMVTIINGTEFNVELSLINKNKLTIDGKTFIGE